MNVLQKAFLILCAFSPVITFAAFEKSTLKTAMEKGFIQINATASGQSYQGNGLHLNLKNRTGKALQLTIDPALIFRPVDTSYQDIVLTGETVVVLAPNGESNIDLQSFCGKSYARAPSKEILFRFVKQGDSVMIKVVQFINKHKLYNSTGQSAIWALTNHHELSGIYDASNPVIANKLVAMMAQLTGWAVPGYFKLYKINTTAGEAVLEPRTLKIYSVFEWKLSEAKMLTLGIYNGSGTLIQSVIDNKKFIKGGYKLTVEFQAQHVDAGNYYIRLKDEATVLKEQVVKID